MIASTIIMEHKSHPAIVMALFKFLLSIKLVKQK